MQCPQCSTENPEKAKFCLECGEKLAGYCPNCDTELPPNAKFCSECGAKVAAPNASRPFASTDRPNDFNNLQRLVPREYIERVRRSSDDRPANERRLVTILFSDMKGSTALAEHMDPEEVLEIINGAFEALIAPIYRHEGTLARLMGDAILAFFGAPVAHEDDPQRAVRAALEIQTGVKVYAEKLARERGIQGFNVRVGINTGLVIVGEVGSDLRVEYTAIGDAINTAARLEQNAPVGGVLISQATYQHVRGLFEVEAQPPLQVKGKSEPLQTYVVQRARSLAGTELRSPERGLEGVQTPLVGREPELLWLQNMYQDTMDENQTRLITVVGDAGVGKSRLLDEFTQQYLPQVESGESIGPSILIGRGVPEQRQQSYSILRNLFAIYLDIQENDTAHQVGERFQQGLAPDLSPSQAELVGQLLGFEISATQAIPGNLATQALNCLEDYFRSSSQHRPVLIILDDLHWADSASLDFFDRLVSTLPDRQLLILCLSRPVLFETRPHWGEGRECYEQLDLRPLSRRNTRHLIRHLLEQAPDLPSDLEELLLKNADGNPYYAEELARMCLEMLSHDKQISVNLIARIPATLAGVLQARLEALSLSEKTLLQQAAVVGREFWDTLLVDLTQASSNQTVRAVNQRLDSLRGRTMVARRERSSFPGANEYTFKHAILQETVYESVLLKQRRQYHARIAAWLEQHAGDRQAEYWPRIAAHYERAGQPELAADFWQQAAENARKKDIWDEAERAYKRVLTLLPPDTPEQEPDIRLRRARILSELGSIKTGQHDNPQARVYLEESIRQADDCPGTEALTALSEAHRKLSLVYFFSDDVPSGVEKGWEHNELGLQAAQQSGNALQIAEILSNRGVMYVFQGHLSDAERWFLESVEHYRQHNFTSIKEACIADYNLVLLILIRLEKRRGNEQKAQTFINELMEFIRRDVGDLEHPLALYARFQLAILNHQDAKAEALARQTIRVAKETGERGLFLGAHSNLTVACWLQGRIAEAERSARQQLAQARSWQNTEQEVAALCDLTRVAQMRQDWQTGKDQIAQALKANQRMLNSETATQDPSILSFAGQFYAAQGNWARASQYFYEALTTPKLESDATCLVQTFLQLVGPLAWRGELELLAEMVGALESMPILYNPIKERLYITPLMDQLDLSKPHLATAYHRGLEDGPLTLCQRLVNWVERQRDSEVA